MKKRIQMTLIFLCVTAFLTMLILQDHNISQEETVFQPTTEIVQREEYNQVRPVIPTLEHEFFMEEEALAYLNEALNIIQTNSYMHDEIDWVEFRERVYAEAQGATRPADTYNAIRYALRLLGDHHSRFFSPLEVLNTQAYYQNTSTQPSSLLVYENIGYLFVPRIAGYGEHTEFYSNELHRIIGELQDAGVCGWVVDLRFNTGGNMWPMLVGLGPILGEGEVGRFIHPNYEETFSYYAGVAYLDERAMAEVNNPVVLVGADYPPIAVLISSFTASSGEAIAIAFELRPNTRSFGEQTMGLTTANQVFSLSDNAVIILAESLMADREGSIYPQGIIPDEFLGSAYESGISQRTNIDLGSDFVFAAAIEWLSTTYNCTNED